MRSSGKIAVLFALAIFGAAVGFLLAASRAAFPSQLTLIDALVLVLALLTGWVRIKVEPSGYATLTPLVLFIAIPLGRPLPALAGSFASILIGARMVSKRPWLDAIEEVGEEMLSAFGLIVVARPAYPVTPDLPIQTASFFLGAVTYLLVKVLVGMARSHLFEGVSPLSFLVSAGRYNVLHTLLLSGLGGSIYLLYGRVGYLVVPLAVIALIEFYYPAKLISEQREVSFASLAIIAQAIDAKDPYTALHSRHVMEIATRIARRMRLPEGEVRKIQTGALLHDIGKIGVSGSIIRKPGRLDSAEERAMREHPVISANIMQPVELLADAAEIVRHHHEHVDGSGYPDGLKGEQIPTGSRIILVADAFDAMTTDRPYRKARSKREGLAVLKEHAGRQFDSRVVDALEAIIGAI